MRLSRYFFIIFFCLSLSNCTHFEQEAAEIDSFGDKYYGARELPRNTQKLSISKNTPKQPDFIPSKIVTNIAIENKAPVDQPVKSDKIGSDSNGVFLYHEVKNGETVYMLSRLYKISPRKIIVNNNINEPYELLIGEVIKIHSPKAVAALKTAKIDSNHVQVVKINNDITIEHPKENKNLQPRKTVKHIKNIKYDDKKFIWPVKGKIISKFGVQASGLKNDGILISAQKGTEILAAKSGEVVYASDDIADFGNMVILKHSQNTFSTYAHQDSILVSKGDKISQGDVVGFIGNTGNIKTPGLYFSVRKGKKLLNPSKLLD